MSTTPPRNEPLKIPPIKTTPSSSSSPSPQRSRLQTPNKTTPEIHPSHGQKSPTVIKFQNVGFRASTTSQVAVKSLTRRRHWGHSGGYGTTLSQNQRRNQRDGSHGRGRGHGDNVSGNGGDGSGNGGGNVITPPVANQGGNFTVNIRDYDTSNSADDNNNGKPINEFTIVINPATTFDEVNAQVIEYFKYTRNAVIRVGVLNCDVAIDLGSGNGSGAGLGVKNKRRVVVSGEYGSHPNNLAPDQSSGQILTSSSSSSSSDNGNESDNENWLTPLHKWFFKASTRRKERVIEIRDEIITAITSATSSSSSSSPSSNSNATATATTNTVQTVQITLGLNRIYELIQRESNIFSITPLTITTTILQNLQSKNYGIGQASARVLWKIAEYTYAFNAMAGDWKVAEALINNLCRRTKCKGGLQDFVNDSYYYNNLGALTTLLKSPPLKTYITTHATPHIISFLSTTKHTPSLKLASETLLHLLLTSRLARVRISQSGAIKVLAGLVNSENTYVVYLAVVAMNVYARTRQDRRLIEPGEVAGMFGELVGLVEWGVNELVKTQDMVHRKRKSKSEAGGTAGYNYNGRSDGDATVVATLLEHATSALYGFAVILHKHDLAKDLINSNGELGFLDVLISLMCLDDIRIHSSVAHTSACTICTLSPSLGLEMSHSPNLLARLLTFIKTKTDTDTDNDCVESIAHSLGHLTHFKTQELSRLVHDGGVGTVLKIIGECEGGGDKGKRELVKAMSLVLANMCSVIPNTANAASMSMNMSMNNSMSLSLSLTVKQLHSIVNLLTSTSQAVLQNITTALKALSYNPSYRKLLGSMYAITGILKLLKANTSIEFKEHAVSCLWLLCALDDNAIRLATGGGSGFGDGSGSGCGNGLRVIISFLTFANLGQYAKLKYYVVGLLFTLQLNANVFQLIKRMKIEKYLIDMLHNSNTDLTVQCHVQTAALLYNLTSKDRDCHARVIQVSGNEQFLEEMFVEMLQDDKHCDVKMLGVHGITLLAMQTKSKKVFGKVKVKVGGLVSGFGGGGGIGVIESLSKMLTLTDDVNNNVGVYSESDHVKVLHALLNLSQVSDNQRQIGELLLPQLIGFTRAATTTTTSSSSRGNDNGNDSFGHDGRGRNDDKYDDDEDDEDEGGSDNHKALIVEFSTSILTNLTGNSECRSMMYKLSLSECSNAIRRQPSINDNDDDNADGNSDGDDDDGMYEGDNGLVNEFSELFSASSTRSNSPISMHEGLNTSMKYRNSSPSPSPSPSPALSPSPATATATAQGTLEKLKARLRRPVNGLWEDVPVISEVVDSLLPRMSLSKQSTASSIFTNGGGGSPSASFPPFENNGGAHLHPQANHLHHPPTPSGALKRAHTQAVFKRPSTAPAPAALSLSLTTPTPSLLRSSSFLPNSSQASLPLTITRGSSRGSIRTSSRASTRPSTTASSSSSSSSMSASSNSLKPKKSNVLSPLRSSHRVGPVGRLGSCATVEGEDRWRPAVVSFSQGGASEDAGDDYDCEHDRYNDNEVVAINSKRKSEEDNGIYNVVLDPPVHYNKLSFNFNTTHTKPPIANKLNTTNNNSKPSPVTLTMWKHVEGSTIGHELYHHFITPSGETLFFYHTSKIVCEALHPGEYPHPPPPDSAAAADAGMGCVAGSQVTLGKIPMLVVPKGDLTAWPVFVLPVLTVCPEIEEHFIPLCALASKAALRTLQPTVEQIRRANMFGCVPIEPIKLTATMEPPPKPPIEVSPIVTVITPVVKEWRLEDSKLFVDRKRTADSRALFDSSSVVNRALQCDFDRMLKEPRLARLIMKEDADVKAGLQPVETELKEIREALDPLYKIILQTFEFYCLIAQNLTRNAFSMGERAYYTFIKDCKFIDNNFTSAHSQSIFVGVNFETDKSTVESEVNDDNCLMRMEFIEVLIRIAIIKYKESANGDISDAVEMLVSENLVPNIPPIGRINVDKFRKHRFYLQSVEAVFISHKQALEVCYTKYKNMKQVGGTLLFSIPNWMLFLNEAGMIGGETDDFSTREALLCFFNARTITVDEVKSRNKYISLSYIDFLEAISRVADTMSVPTDEMIEKIGGCENMFHYRQKRAGLTDLGLKRELGERRMSSDFLYESERTLAEKLDKVLNIIFGNLGRFYKGVLMASARVTCKLSPRYLTVEQILEH